jgi:two-component system, cell cycle response regulator
MPKRKDLGKEVGADSDECPTLAEHIHVTRRSRGENVERPVYTPLLICVEGPQEGARFPITNLENRIGRASSSEIHIQDEMASRRHAKITYRNWQRPHEPPDCIIEDMGSLNGILVNGDLARGPRPLRERDRILIGSSLMGFFLRDEVEFQHEKNLYEKATRDALTGLDNRHQFRTHLVHHVRRALRYGRPLSLMIIDVDHFKAVNDSHGHDVGDLVLTGLAKVIRTCCRASELCARWGGEEFTVLLPESDGVAAVALADRIRHTIEAKPLRADEHGIGLTVSIGVAELQPDDSVDTFFRRSDQRLLAAKDRGRNRIVFEPASATSASSTARRRTDTIE